MRQLALRIALIAALLTTGQDVRAQSQDPSDSSEYFLKAGFIYNFAKLVEWPTGALGSPSSAIVIGVLGDDSVARIIEDVVSGKKLDGHTFAVKRLKWSKDFVCNCQMLFITARENSHTDEIVARKTPSVLTIAETPGFGKRGVMINFILEESKIRFEANVEAARQAGLNVSSRLLNLAKIVQTEKREVLP
jgi:hypothetical protein